MSKAIVNPRGTVHTVTDQHAEQLLAQPGYRLADPGEIPENLGQPVNETAGDDLPEPSEPATPAEPSEPATPAEPAKGKGK